MLKTRLKVKPGKCRKHWHKFLSFATLNYNTIPLTKLRGEPSTKNS